MVRRRRRALGIVGFLLTVFGMVTTVAFLKANAEFDAGHGCTRSIALSTSPYVGRTCSIFVGTISWK
jgi:hypothetical protein